MNPALTLYGIRNCSSVKKARQWLQAHGLEAAFHDYKKSAIDHARLQARAAQLDDASQLPNKRGTTCRCPVPERADGSLLTGFDEALWQDTLLEHKP